LILFYHSYFTIHHEKTTGTRTENNKTRNISGIRYSEPLVFNTLEGK